MDFRVINQISEINKEKWNRLVPVGDPFVRWEWLSAMEESGSADAQSGWQPFHLTLSQGSDLVAAAPAYVKHDSDGDFSRDWGFADACHRARIPYYPKLIVTVPFTPVTGRRLLVADGFDRESTLRELLAGAEKAARAAGIHSMHVLFPTSDEAELLDKIGLTSRVAFQYHWYNQNYSTSDDFLACLNSKKRNQAKRERAAPAKQGINIRTVRGQELAADPLRWAHIAYKLHSSTVDKLMWGRHWLNRGLYERAFVAMPECMEVVCAEREGKIIAGAFNVATDTHLYGRYWGCFEEHPFLHFNVCYYHSIDECIRRGIGVFEGGAGGEHKIARGFEPAETYSAHKFFHPQVNASIGPYLAHESEERRAALARWKEETPIVIRMAPGAK